MAAADDSSEPVALPQAAVDAHVLVAYATSQGSTAQVAERIATVLQAGGHRADARPVGAAAPADDYDAVVLGSPVYNGAWLPAAQEYVRANTGALAGRPLWLFSVGTFGDRKRAIGALMRREPKDIAALRAALGPREYRVFAGVIARGQWSVLPRLLLRACGGRIGDNRDWDDIEAWAAAIGHALRTQVT